MMDFTSFEQKHLVPGTPPDVAQAYFSLAERAAKTEAAALGLEGAEWVVVDTETTGVDAHEDALIEIAAVRMRGFEVVEEFQTFVNPERPIPDFITDLTSITDADVAGAPGQEEAVVAFASFAGAAPLVAHNASFDQGFLEARGFAGGPWLDSCALAKVVLPRMRNHKLPDLSRAFGVYASTHRAIDDVRSLAEVWRLLWVAAAGLPAGLCGEIARMSPKTDWPLRQVFEHLAEVKEDSSVHFSLKAARRERVREFGATSKGDAEALGEPIQVPSPEALAQAFSAEGLCGTIYPGFETRGEQLDMACEVAAAFRDSEIRVLEAGTGVGKSMAYLLPAALTAQRNGITVGIATKTNTLLDQLMYKELPQLSAALAAEEGGQPLRYVALKGYENYPCLRKVETLVLDKEARREPHEIEMLATLLSFSSQTAFGDLDQLKLYWGRLPRWFVQAQSADCLKRKCPFYGSGCFLHGARQAAKCSDVVVTNHALLFRDMQAEGALLPPVRHWIVDEAHGAEEEARKQLSSELSSRELSVALNRIAGSRGSIATVQKKASEVPGGNLLLGRCATIETLCDNIRPKADGFFEELRLVQEAALSMPSNFWYSRSDLWLSPELRASEEWQDASMAGAALGSKLVELTRHLQHLLASFEDFESEGSPFDAQAADISQALCMLTEMAHALDLVLDGTEPNYTFCMEMGAKREDAPLRIRALQVEVGDALVDKFYPESMSVVFTSATLATGGRDPFAHITRTLGLQRDELCCETRVEALQFAASYDYNQQMRVLVPQGMTAPKSGNRGQHARYLDELTELIYGVHVAQGGSVLTLFTSTAEMKQVYEALKPRFEAAGLKVLAQGISGKARDVGERFLNEEATSLFGLRSFWEGFDAPGETLRCVILAKLPFSSLSEPVLAARKLNDNDAWANYAVPAAVMQVKQMAGRLIRSASDSGTFILADTRCTWSWYRDPILGALPSTNIQLLPANRIFEVLRN